MILKRNNDPRRTESYRPISLLNTDYKILPSILARWLYWILGYYIHSDQIGFMKNKYMKDNVWRDKFDLI